MPRPSWARYSSTPEPAWAIWDSARSSCSPQSHRNEPKTSPVRHSECTRTSTSGLPVDLAAHERDVLLAVDHRPVAVGGERAVLRGHVGDRDPLDQPLRAAPVGDEVGDGDHLQAVADAVGGQVGHPRHRAVVVHDLADHAGGREPGQPGEVDRRLGLPHPLEHAVAARPQREHVPRLDEVAGLRRGVDRNADGVGAVGGRDARRHPGARLDRDRERGAERRLVVASSSGTGRARRSGSPRAPGRSARGRASP